MQAIEFEAKTIDGMIPIPEHFGDIKDNEFVRVIVLKKDELEIYKENEQFQIDKKALQGSVDDYRENGDKNFISQDEYHKKMNDFKKDLIAKYANH